jgi:hypothetical protein
MEIIAEKIVTTRDPMISGSIPNSGGSYVGYQYSPKMKSFTETCLKTGKPSMKRNMEIIKRIVMEAVAINKNR